MATVFLFGFKTGYWIKSVYNAIDQNILSDNQTENSIGRLLVL